MFDVKLSEEAEKFMLDLARKNSKLQAKAFWTIDRLKHEGDNLGMPHSKLIQGTDGKIRELRVKQGSNICRLFYFKHNDTLYIVTSGYIKKTDKTSPEEITRALRLMEEFINESSRF